MGYDWTERRISTRRLNDEMCQAVEDETISSIRQLIARGFGGVGQAGYSKIIYIRYCTTTRQYGPYRPYHQISTGSADFLSLPLPL